MTPKPKKPIKVIIKYERTLRELLFEVLNIGNASTSYEQETHKKDAKLREFITLIDEGKLKLKVEQ